LDRNRSEFFMMHDQPATDALIQRTSRRLATRKEISLACQAVRERDFVLVAERTLDVSVDGVLLPLKRPLLTGESLIVSFEIPGLWIDAECTVTRVIHGRRPADEGVMAVGVQFDVLAPSARAALAGYLHGKHVALPRRGPLARVRRGESRPTLADEDLMKRPLSARHTLRVEPVLPRVDPVGVLRELASALASL
jgi:hypothetical protein